VPHGRDPVPAPGARVGSQRRPVGLPVQRHQDVPPGPDARPARPRPAHDDHAVHARVHRAARADVPSPRCSCDRGHGGIHPVAPRYLDAWLRGTGAAAIFNLMEDAATAEISRSQLWLWRTRGVTLEDGRRVDAALLRTIRDEEIATIRASEDGTGASGASRLD